MPSIIATYSSPLAFDPQYLFGLASLENKNAALLQSFSISLCRMGAMGRPDDQEGGQTSRAEPGNVILLPALKVGAFAGERISPKSKYYSVSFCVNHSQKFEAQHLIQLIGSAGFIVGGFAGLSRLSTPGLFALVSGFQWFALGSTFWGTCSDRALTSLLNA